MKKVLWATNSFGLGGAERQIANMAGVLTQNGFEIDVVYYSNKDTRMLESNNSGLNTIFIDKDSIGNFKCLLELRKLIKKNKYDIVHAFGGGSANIYSRYAAFFTGTKVVIGAMLGKKHFSNLINRLINSVANLRSDYWTVNNVELTPILLHDLKFIKKQHVFLLNNGFFDREVVDYKEDAHTYYDDLKGDNRIVIAVGRLVKVKNNLLLVKAALEVIKKDDKVHFWIIGDGPMYQELTELIQQHNAQDKIKLLGYRSDIDVALSRADIFTLTSFTEGSPNAMAEAMRAKKPVISTKCTSLTQFIVEKKNGLSVEIDHKDELVEAIGYLLSKSNDELVEMGEFSYELFRNNFKIDKVAKEFEHLYNKLLERGNS